MAKPTKDSSSVTFRVATETLNQLDSMVDERKKAKPGVTYTRTDALAEILPLGLQALENPKAFEVGMIVLKHIDKLSDPQWVADMKKRLEEIALVDFVAKLDSDRLDSLAAIVFDELRIQAGKRPYSLLDVEEKRKMLLK